jgi:hypothetical protein
MFVWAAVALGASTAFCLVAYLLFLGFVIVAMKAFRTPSLWPSRSDAGSEQPLSQDTDDRPTDGPRPVLAPAPREDSDRTA